MKKIRDFFASILIVVMLLLTVLVSALRTPFDYLAYKRSAFYRDFKRKYQMFICTKWEYRMYNLVKEKNLPIRYFPENPEKPEDGGYFLYKQTLIVNNLMQVQFRESDQRWVFQYTKDTESAAMPIMDYVMDCVTAVNALPGHKTVSHMLIPIHRKQVAKQDRARIERDPRFLMHNGDDLGELLEAYIITHPKG